jgi:D-hexose-6-phosphate mutarotase
MSLTTSRLEKIGFLSQLPPKANIDDFEVITINGISGKKLKMYRKKKEQIDKDGLEDFTHSWTTFQQNLS